MSNEKNEDRREFLKKMVAASMAALHPLPLAKKFVNAEKAVENSSALIVLFEQLCSAAIKFECAVTPLRDNYFERIFKEEIEEFTVGNDKSLLDAIESRMHGCIASSLELRNVGNEIAKHGATNEQLDIIQAKYSERMEQIAPTFSDDKLFTKEGFEQYQKDGNIVFGISDFKDQETDRSYFIHTKDSRAAIVNHAMNCFMQKSNWHGLYRYCMEQLKQKGVSATAAAERVKTLKAKIHKVIDQCHKEILHPTKMNEAEWVARVHEGMSREDAQRKNFCID